MPSSRDQAGTIWNQPPSLFPASQIYTRSNSWEGSTLAFAVGVAFEGLICALIHTQNVARVCQLCAVLYCTRLCRLSRLDRLLAADLARLGWLPKAFKKGFEEATCRKLIKPRVAGKRAGKGRGTGSIVLYSRWRKGVHGNLIYRLRDPEK
jgi:hypothetical protein